MNDYSFAAALAVALLIATYFIGKLSARSTNTVLIHNLSWAFALSVYSLHWIEYTDVSSTAWTIIVLGIAAFNIGALLPLSVRASDGTAQSFVPTSLAWATVVLPVLFLSGALFYLRTVSSQFGLDSLIHNASAVRTFQGTDQFGVAFPLYGRLLYFLGPLVFVLYANPWLSGIRVTRKTQVLVLTLTSLVLALSLERTLLLVALVWQAAIVFIRPRRHTSATNLRRFAVLIGLGLVTIIAFQALGALTHKSGATDSRIQPYVQGPLRGKSYTSFVTYASGGIPAFSQLTMDGLHGNYADGKATLGPVAKAIPTLHPPNQVGAFASIPFPHNAYTWLETYYRDFGPPGCVILPFLMGFILGRAAGVRQFSSEGLLIAALLLGLGVWAPLVNQYPSSFTWEYAIILVVCLRRQRRRGARQRRVTSLTSRISDDTRSASKVNFAK